MKMKRLDFYEHLRSLGFTENDALSLARQSSMRTIYKSAYHAVHDCVIWARTVEGTGYWKKVALAFAPLY